LKAVGVLETRRLAAGELQPQAYGQPGHTCGHLRKRYAVAPGGLSKRQALTWGTEIGHPHRLRVHVRMPWA